MPVNNIQVNFKSKHSYRIRLCVCVCCISVTNEDLSQPESCEFTGCRRGLEGTATHFNDEQIPSVTRVCVCACVNSILDSDNAQIQSLS